MNGRHFTDLLESRGKRGATLAGFRKLPAELYQVVRFDAGIFFQLRGIGTFTQQRQMACLQRFQLVPPPLLLVGEHRLESFHGFALLLPQDVAVAVHQRIDEVACLDRIVRAEADFQNRRVDHLRDRQRFGDEADHVLAPSVGDFQRRGLQRAANHLGTAEQFGLGGRELTRRHRRRTVVLCRPFRLDQHAARNFVGRLFHSQVGNA